MQWRLPDKLANLLLGKACDLSNDSLYSILCGVERFCHTDWHLKGVEALKRMTKENHPGIEAVRRSLKNCNPKTRSAIFNVAILNSLLGGGWKRRYGFWEENGVTPPGALQISVTNACNLNCYGCATGTNKTVEPLTKEEVLTLVAAAEYVCTNSIFLLGGEPFMVPWLLDVVEAFPRMIFQIYTNGHLITDEHVRRLADLGNAAVTLGLDGLKESTDSRKGEGAYAKSISAMSRLRDAGVLVGFSAMLSHKSVDEIYSDEFLDTMIENGASYGWLPAVVPQGYAATDLELMLTPEDKEKIKGKLAVARKSKPLLLIDFYSDAYLTEGCGAARTVLHVNANGDVEPCILFPFAVENIRNKPYSEIIKSDFFKDIRCIRDRGDWDKQTCLMNHRPKEVLETVEKHQAYSSSQGTLERLYELVKKN